MENLLVASSESQFRELCLLQSASACASVVAMAHGRLRRFAQKMAKGRRFKKWKVRYLERYSERPRNAKACDT